MLLNLELLPLPAGQVVLFNISQELFMLLNLELLPLPAG